MVKILATLLLSLAITASAQAGSISMTLTDLFGPMATGEDSKTTQYDFGVPFESIDEVYLDLKIVKAQPGIYDHIHANGTRTRHEFDLSVVGSSLGEPSQSESANESDGVAFTHRVSFHNRYPDFFDYYDPMRDGQGEIQITSYFQHITVGFSRLEVIEPARGTIVDARLTVVSDRIDGHSTLAIPEPTTLTLAAFALLGLAGRRRRHSS